MESLASAEGFANQESGWLERSRGGLLPGRPFRFGIPKFVMTGFARGQDGLTASNFSKNNKTISIIKQSYKWRYTTEYAGISRLALLTVTMGF